MNSISSANLGLLGLFESPVASSQAGMDTSALLGMLPQGQSQENFQNLLDIVSDLDLADSQTIGAQDEANENIESMIAVESPLLLQGMNQAQLALNPPQFDKSVGLDIPLQNKQRNPETLSKIDVVAEQLSRQAYGLEAMRNNQALPQSLDTQSLQMWSAALASGDVSKVEIASDPKMNKAAAFAPELVMPVADKAQGEKMNVAKMSQEIKTPAQFIEKDSKVEKLDQKMNLAKDAMTEKAESAPVQSPKKAQSASSFLLEQSHKHSHSSDSNNQPLLNPGSHDLKPALAAGPMIGQPEDNRISPQAVGFVADKVESLRSQGGGKMKLELDSKELGVVELKVGLRGSKVEVQMISDRPEVQKVLDASKGDLIKAMESKHGLQANIVESKAQVWTAHHSVDSAKKSAQTSDAILGVRQSTVASKSAPAQDMQDHHGGKISSHHMEVDSSDAGMNSKMEGRSFESQAGTQDNREGRSQQGLNQWSREDRREKALEQWEQNFADRKSA